MTDRDLVERTIRDVIDSMRRAGITVSDAAENAMVYQGPPVGCPLCGGHVGRFCDHPCRCLSDHGDDEQRSSKGR